MSMMICECKMTTREPVHHVRNGLLHVVCWDCHLLMNVPDSLTDDVSTFEFELEPLRRRRRFRPFALSIDQLRQLRQWKLERDFWRAEQTKRRIEKGRPVPTKRRNSVIVQGNGMLLFPEINKAMF